MREELGLRRHRVHFSVSEGPLTTVKTTLLGNIFYYQLNFRYYGLGGHRRGFAL
jgi:hypothetical protein